MGYRLVAVQLCGSAPRLTDSIAAPWAVDLWQENGLRQRKPRVVGFWARNVAISDSQLNGSSRITGKRGFDLKEEEEEEGAVAVAVRHSLQDPDGDELEDLAIYVVGDVTAAKKEILRKRALRLQHQEDVEFLIRAHARDRQKVRTVGFPSVSKEIKYDEAKAFVQPRGFHGTLEGDSEMKNRYKVEGLNWK